MKGCSDLHRLRLPAALTCDSSYLQVSPEEELARDLFFNKLCEVLAVSQGWAWLT